MVLNEAMDGEELALMPVDGYETESVALRNEASFEILYETSYGSDGSSLPIFTFSDDDDFNDEDDDFDDEDDDFDDDEDDEDDDFDDDEIEDDEDEDDDFEEDDFDEDVEDDDVDYDDFDE